MSGRPPFPGLGTERLCLREATGQDAAFVLRLVTDPDWRRFIGESAVSDLAGARCYIERALAPLYARGVGLWLVELRATGEPLGIAGIVERDTLDHPDLGFAFLPEHRGRGHAREACLAVLDFARDALGLDRLVAVTRADNTPSIGLLEKLGFAREGSRRLAEGGPVLELYACELQLRARSSAPDGAGAAAEPIPVFGPRVPGAVYTLRPGGYALFSSGAGQLAVVRVSSGLYLPGGGQEPGETLEESAAREVREECGLEVRVGARFFVADQLVHAVSSGSFVRKRCSFFRAELRSRSGLPTEEDHELCWVRPDEAARTLRHASQRHAVARAFGLELEGEGS